MNIEELYAEYFNDIYKFVFSLTKNSALTDDIVQETFTRAYLHIGSFRDLPNKAWLITVSRNIFYDYLRKNKKTADIEYDFSAIPDPRSSPEEELFKKENIQNLNKEIMALRENYRNALICFYIKDLNYKEAAIEMNVTESNFKSILFRAKQKLKRALEKKGDSFE
ncbi:sigma-70 family RNA polymerase sigma factor [Heyndrickxia sporothermodurans]|uniref:RNA polymerase sigma factor n=1 Tax=Heyndrickxia sporothermodurans TaxID=46224 RepID=UPI002DBDB2E2|nr:sigma-70 family RNA polymerase sigma factor [Heyndrickxia sporothermodurans]MEB6549739.1 sigma-70 family RNA polymerase sigma factor [Heyndrickxia sporothermodurans]